MAIAGGAQRRERLIKLCLKNARCQSVWATSRCTLLDQAVVLLFISTLLLLHLAFLFALGPQQNNISFFPRQKKPRGSIMIEGIFVISATDLNITFDKQNSY